ncbi:MAG: hypothetical protein EZS28_032113 [Streblomastix strix]|uniref:Uncharacterized protein n=1 Tax=Streblomastix strix TaxID=222440 RepID=A0A5J4UQQ9_9EUKA|nr:MAG: hypothetical protein EZS28_032113 [Streblomastix strix]
MLEESPAISLSVPNDLQTLTQNVAVPFALPPVMLHQETFIDLLKVVIENIQDRERGGKYDQSELEKEDDTPSRSMQL